MVQVGDRVPELGPEYTALWQGGPALLLWLRHFGCQFYPETLTELRDAAGTFQDLGVTVRCVVQGDSAEAREFCGNFGAEQLCIGDPDRRSYRLMGLERATLCSILFPTSELKARRCDVQAKGYKQDWRNTFRKNGDALQLPGAALIAASGTLRWLHRGKHTGDLPPVATLIDVAQQFATR